MPAISLFYELASSWAMAASALDAEDPAAGAIEEEEGEPRMGAVFGRTALFVCACADAAYR